MSVSVTDSEYIDQTSFTVTVNPTNDAPVLSDIGAHTLNEDTDLTVTLFATDVDGTDELTYLVDGTDDLNVSVDGNILTIDPLLDYNGSGEITVTVTDNIFV